MFYALGPVSWIGNTSVCRFRTQSFGLPTSLCLLLCFKSALGSKLQDATVFRSAHSATHSVT